MSIKIVLLRNIAIVLMATLLLGAVLTYYHAQQKIKTEMNAAIAVGARIAHNAVDDAEEVTNPPRRLQLLVADFNGDRHLKAFVRTSDGKLKYESVLQPPEEEAPAWLYSMLNPKGDSVAVPLPMAFNGLGQFYLQTDARNEIAEVWEDIQNFATILAIFCSAGVMATIATLGRAFRPITELVKAFESVGQGDYRPRISETGAMELDTLAQGFNRMAQHLSDMEDRNARLNNQLDTVQEEERTALARNLHDEVSPLLFCVDVDARAIRELSYSIESPNDAKCRANAEAIQSAVNSLKQNVKGILSELRPSSFHAIALNEGIDDLIDFWRTRHPHVSFDIDVADERFGARIEQGLLAIAQECVSNAFQHARPTRVRVEIEPVGKHITLSVENDGGHLATNDIGSGFGIKGMKERASNLGGSLSIGNSDIGVLVQARIPATLHVRSSECPSVERECE